MSATGEMGLIWSMGVLAAEAMIIIAVAFAGERFIQNPYAQRALWRAAFLGLALLVGIELSNFRHAVQSALTPKVGAVSRPPTSTVQPQTDSASRANPSIIEHETSQPIPEEHFSTVLNVPIATEANLPSLLPIIAFGIWSLGSLFFVLRALLGYSALCLLVCRSCEVPDSLRKSFHRLSPRFDIRAKVLLRASPLLPTPVVGGILRGFILLPDDFHQRFNEAEQEVILAHEMEHLRAHDARWLGLVEIVQACFWWHPLVWMAKRRFSQVVEEAADSASVVAPEEARLLADCLLRFGRELVAGKSRRLPALGVGFHSGLGARVQKLLDAPESSWDAPKHFRLRFYTFAAPITLVLILLTTTVWLLPEQTKGSSMWKSFSKQWQALAAAGASLVAPMEAAQPGAQRAMPMANLIFATNTVPYPRLNIAEDSAADKNLARRHGVFPIGRSAEEYRANPNLAANDGVLMLGPSLDQYRANTALQQQEGVVLLASANQSQTRDSSTLSKIPLLDRLFPEEPPLTHKPTLLAQNDVAQPSSDPVPAPTKPKAETYRNDGLDFYRQNPELAKRYGLVPSTNAPNAATVPSQPAAPGKQAGDRLDFYRQNPELMQRYGLIPNTNVTVGASTPQATSTPAPTGDGLDFYRRNPELAKRYGLVPRGADLEPKPTATEMPKPATVRHNEAALQRLKDVQFDVVQYEGVPLNEVLKELTHDLRKRVSGRPINVILKPAEEGETSPLKDAKITIDPPIRDVSLAELLDILVQVSPVPLAYQVEEYGIVFSRADRGPSPGATTSRTTQIIKISAQELFGGMESSMGILRPKSKQEGMTIDHQQISNLQAARAIAAKRAEEVANGLATAEDLAEAKKRVQDEERKLSEALYNRMPAEQRAELGRSRHAALQEFLTKLGIATNAPNVISYDHRTESLVVSVANEDSKKITAALVSFGWNSGLSQNAIHSALRP